VRPGTDADEMIKRKEKLARDRMGQEFERMKKEQQRLEEVSPHGLVFKAHRWLYHSTLGV